MSNDQIEEAEVLEAPSTNDTATKEAIDKIVDNLKVAVDTDTRTQDSDLDAFLKTVDLSTYVENKNAVDKLFNAFVEYLKEDAKNDFLAIIAATPNVTVNDRLKEWLSKEDLEVHIGSVNPGKSLLNDYLVFFNENVRKVFAETVISEAEAIPKRNEERKKRNEEREKRNNERIAKNKEIEKRNSKIEQENEENRKKNLEIQKANRKLPKGVEPTQLIKMTPFEVMEELETLEVMESPIPPTSNKKYLEEFFGYTDHRSKINDSYIDEPTILIAKWREYNNSKTAAIEIEKTNQELTSLALRNIGIGGIILVTLAAAAYAISVAM